MLIKPLGVDIEDFASNLRHAQKLKERFSIKGQFVIGFVGALSTYHGVNYLIEAAKRLNITHPDKILIVIVGWSSRGEILKSRVESLGLQNVIFTGNVDKRDIADYYKIFDVGVIPDCEESMYPIKVLEYGIFNLCPLVPEYFIFKEIISEPDSGYFFQPRNSKSLSDKILQMYKERDNCSSCGNKWNLYVSQNFKWKDTVKEVIGAFSNHIINRS